MCSKCIFKILDSHCGFCSSILDVYFPYLFKINQINLLAALRKHKKNVKTIQKISNIHIVSKWALFPAAVTTVTQVFQNSD